MTAGPDTPSSPPRFPFAAVVGAQDAKLALLLAAMRRHGYKGAFEVAATVDYLFGYDATAGVVEDWMYERVTQAYVADPEMRDFYERSNPWALRGICERLLEAAERGMWDASADARATLRDGLLAAEGREERLAADGRNRPLAAEGREERHEERPVTRRAP